MRVELKNIFLSNPGFICAAGDSENPESFVENLASGNRDGIKKTDCGLVGVRIKEAAKEAVTRCDALYGALENLEEKHRALKEYRDAENAAHYCRDELLPAMDALRDAADSAETLCPKDLWRVPTYEELLFSI